MDDDDKELFADQQLLAIELATAAVDSGAGDLAASQHIARLLEEEDLRPLVTACANLLNELLARLADDREGRRAILREIAAEVEERRAG